MPLLKELRVAGEFVRHFPPRVVGIRALELLPMLLNLRPFMDGHQLERPEQDLPEVPDYLMVLRRSWL
jgi:hypothetical protein